ncbi:MAG: LEPR-XLL domain-containing protein, partial [Planctomycetota bacterium]
MFRRRSNEKGATKRSDNLKQGQPVLIEVFEPRILLSANPLLDNPLTRTLQEDRDALSNVTLIETDTAADVLSEEMELICLDDVADDETAEYSAVAIDDLINSDVSKSDTVSESSVADETAELRRADQELEAGELAAGLDDQTQERDASVDAERADSNVIAESVEHDDSQTIADVTSGTKPAGVLENQPDSEI